MIANDGELQVTMYRIAKFQQQLVILRAIETNTRNYHASALGYLAEIDRMQLEVREFLSVHPAEFVESK